MTLQEKLNELKANSVQRIPKEALTVMHRATDDLSNSGIMDRVVKIGDKAPDFELKDNNDNVIRLKDVLLKAPLVLSFYRGKW